jgi:selenocysteine lyase/cysteine desulfurase
LLLSHVSCIDGRVLPVTEAVAHTRRAGGISLIDGAQALGQIPVDVRKIDADYYIGSCHKWLLGPSGLGYIHVRGDRLAAFNPNWTPAADIVRPTAAALGEVGATNLALRAGANVALEQIEAIGMATVAEHCQAIAAALRAGLLCLRGVSLLGPDDPEHTTGLVGFTVAGWNSDDCRALVDRLYREHRILIKHQPEHSGLRVSIAAFNTSDECGQLLAALGQELGNDASAF